MRKGGNVLGRAGEMSGALCQCGEISGGRMSVSHECDRSIALCDIVGETELIKPMFIESIL